MDLESLSTGDSDEFGTIGNQQPNESVVQQAGAEGQDFVEESESYAEGGRSWLSNSAIIATLSTRRLTSAALYHKHMALLLNNELVARSFGLNQDRAKAPYARGNSCRVGAGAPRATLGGVGKAKAEQVAAGAIAALGKDFVLNYLKEKLKCQSQQRNTGGVTRGE